MTTAWRSSYYCATCLSWHWHDYACNRDPGGMAQQQSIAAIEAINEWAGKVMAVYEALIALAHEAAHANENNLIAYARGIRSAIERVETALRPPLIVSATESEA